MKNFTTINKFVPISSLYFFFNGLFLPQGLLYTTLLTPFFILWLNKYGDLKKLPIFFAFIIPFLIIHLFNGVVLSSYFKSLLLFFSVFIFSLAFYRFLSINNSLKVIFKNILYINAFLVLIALLALFIPSITNLFWYSNAITNGYTTFKRLKLLTYEPSYYSLLFVPIALYYYLKLILLKLSNPYLTLLLITVPLLLSLSFGVLSGMLVALTGALLVAHKTKNSAKSAFLFSIAALTFLVFTIGAFVYFFPNNVVSVRLMNVISLQDISFMGRTSDSFYLGFEIAEKKNKFFGSGLGQIKELGLELFKTFYNFTGFTKKDIGIPNATGDTLAIFGIIGVSLRLFFGIYFFLKTRTYDNIYRLALFLFIFIYQFTGSYIMNIAEYVIWILAFYKPIFPEFNKTNFKRTHPE